MKGDLAHVLNRGFNKTDIFLTFADYFRFMESLFSINNQSGKIRFQGESIFKNIPDRDCLVDILKWTLMPNHYHLLLHERIAGGISEFTRRLGDSYTKYFNIKNKRSGFLFQNSARIIPAESDKHFNFLPAYIDLNSVELIVPNWKEEGIDSDKKRDAALNFMKSYPWSSYADYSGQPAYRTGRHGMSATLAKGRNASINKGLFFELFDTDQETYEQELISFLKNGIA